MRAPCLGQGTANQICLHDLAHGACAERIGSHRPSVVPGARTILHFVGTRRFSSSNQFRTTIRFDALPPPGNVAELRRSTVHVVCAKTSSLVVIDPLVATNV